MGFSKKHNQEPKKVLSYRRAGALALHVTRHHLVRTVITIILLTVCCTMFSVCMSTVTSYTGLQIKIFRADDSPTVAIGTFDLGTALSTEDDNIFSYTTFYNAGNVQKNKPVQMTSEQKEEITSALGEPIGYFFMTGYSQTSDVSNLSIVSNDYNFASGIPVWYFGDYDRKAYYEEYNELILAGEESPSPTYNKEYVAQFQNDTNCHLNSFTSMDTVYCYVPDGCLSNYNATLLAGSLPQAVDEIAINECWLEMFIEHGYYLYEDIESGTLILPTYNVSDGVTNSNYPSHYILNIDELPSLNEENVVQITCAEDMIGKTIALYGNIEEGIAYSTSSNDFYTVTITGVVDTGCDREFDYNSGNLNYTLYDKIFVSEEWMQTFSGTTCYVLMYSRPTSRSEILKFLEIEDASLNEVYAAEEGTKLESVVLIGDADLLDLREYYRTTASQVRVLGGAASAFFGVFAILLCFNLLSVSIQGERRQIGILRSLGAGKGDINKIFLAQCLFIGAVVFILSLCGMFGVVYGLLDLQITGTGVYGTQTGILQIGTLLVLSLGVPLASGAITLRSFSRYSPTQLMSDNFKNKNKHKKERR